MQITAAHVEDVLTAFNKERERWAFRSIFRDNDPYIIVRTSDPYSKGTLEEYVDIRHMSFATKIEAQNFIGRMCMMAALEAVFGKDEGDVACVTPDPTTTESKTLPA